jgi:hypothetical protein
VAAAGAVAPPPEAAGIWVRWWLLAGEDEYSSLFLKTQEHKNISERREKAKREKVGFERRERKFVKNERKNREV